MEKHIIENEIPKGETENIGSNLDDFEILQTLGKGSYGFVSKVKSKKNQKIYAMKMIDLSLVNDEQECNLLKNEIKILHQLNNPHIIKYYYNFQVGNKIYILMEYINNGDIKGYIQANLNMQKEIPEEEIWNIMYQCFSGLCYIHHNKLIHRDIKPANLFLTEDKIVKIGDFGVSAERKLGGDFQTKIQKETLMIGTPLYMSPEVFAHQPYGSKIDVYSLGCTLYELCHFSAPRLPLPGVNQMGEIFTDLKDMPPKANFNYSQELENLIRLMIEKDQSKRPNSGAIFDQIKMIYNSKHIQSTSIFCVYRCLLSFPNLYNKLQKHVSNNQPIDSIPITSTFRLALNHLCIPNSAYPIIHSIRDILTFYNSTLIDPGEIECNDLVNYILSGLFGETNHNQACKAPYLFTEESDENSFNKEVIMQKYLLNFQNYFKSFISHYFFGTLLTNRTCTKCGQSRTFFENFYYLTINVNSALKAGLNPKDPNFIQNCLGNAFNINVNKFCPVCNFITIQQESEEIVSNPLNLILFIKNDDENNINNLNYPPYFNLMNKLANILNPTNNNANVNIDTFTLRAVIQKSVINGQKSYACCFPYNQNWYTGNGYNLMEMVENPYKLNFGSIAMLFYSSDK